MLWRPARCRALVAVTFNTIRLQILTRREEIEVAKLIGATDAFIRRPFLYFGALQGLAGGLLLGPRCVAACCAERGLADLAHSIRRGFSSSPALDAGRCCQPCCSSRLLLGLAGRVALGSRAILPAVMRSP